MSSRHSNNVICDCGYKAKIRLREGDGGAKWENYTLEGLEGETYYAPLGATMDIVLKHMRPVCPKCRHNITTQNLEWQ